MAVTGGVALSGTAAILRPIDERDGPALEILCEDCADFTLEVTGLPPGPAEAQSIFLSLPPLGDYSRKRLWGVFAEERLIGVVDAYVGHPDADHFWIGLFMLQPAARRRGLGTAVIGFLKAFAAENGIGTLSLAVKSDYDAAQAFWAAQNFQKIRTTNLDMAGHGPTDFDVLTLPL